MSAPILIVGIKDIADTLGLAPSAIKYHLVNTPNFPATKIKPGNKWVTTRPQLQAWAETVVSSPPSDDHIIS